MLTPVTRAVLHLFISLHTCNSWHLLCRQALNIATFNELHFSKFSHSFPLHPSKFLLITCNLWRCSISPSEAVGDKENCVSHDPRLTFSSSRPVLRSLPVSTYTTQCVPFSSCLCSRRFTFLGFHNINNKRESSAVLVILIV